MQCITRTGSTLIRNEVFECDDLSQLHQRAGRVLRDYATRRPGISFLDGVGAALEAAQVAAD